MKLCYRLLLLWALVILSKGCNPVDKEESSFFDYHDDYYYNLILKDDSLSPAENKRLQDEAPKTNWQLRQEEHKKLTVKSYRPVFEAVGKTNVVAELPIKKLAKALKRKKSIQED